MAVLSLADIQSLAADGGYGSVKQLSQVSLALLLSAIELYGNLESWADDPDELTDAQRDEIEAIVATATAELMREVAMTLPIGTIFAWPSNITTTWPQGALRCDNTTHDRADYPLLYDLLDPAFHVSATQFRTPNLRYRFVRGIPANGAVGFEGGRDTVTLDIDEIPAHTHQYFKNAGGFQSAQVGGGVVTPLQPEIFANTGAVGGNRSHENRPPFLHLVYLIQGDA